MPSRITHSFFLTSPGYPRQSKSPGFNANNRRRQIDDKAKTYWWAAMSAYYFIYPFLLHATTRLTMETTGMLLKNDRISTSDSFDSVFTQWRRPQCREAIVKPRSKILQISFHNFWQNRSDKTLNYKIELRTLISPIVRWVTIKMILNYCLWSASQKRFRVSLHMIHDQNVVKLMLGIVATREAIFPNVHSQHGIKMRFGKEKSMHFPSWSLMSMTAIRTKCCSAMYLSKTGYWLSVLPFKKGSHNVAKLYWGILSKEPSLTIRYLSSFFS